MCVCVCVGGGVENRKRVGEEAKSKRLGTGGLLDAGSAGPAVLGLSTVHCGHRKRDSAPTRRVRQR